MSIIQGTSKSSAAGYSIDQSIRFNDGDTPSLSRTIGTPTSTQKFTFSTWIKPCTFFNDTATRAIFSAATPGNSSSDRDIISWENDKLYVAFNTGSWAEIKTNQVFRDPASWYHIVVAMDTTQSTASDRTKIYVNGSQVTDFSTASYVAQNDTIAICTSGKLQAIGAYAFDITAANDRIDGYLAEINFIDGQQLAPTSFGETNSDTGQWVPVKYAGSYGTNGFHIDGRDSSDLGDDESGNGNDYTSSGLTSADSVSDTPTDNFATWNPLIPLSNGSFSDGNLQFTQSGGSISQHAKSTISFTSGEKKVCEMQTVSGASITLGICDEDFVADANGFSGDSRGYFDTNGNKVDKDGNSSSYGASFSSSNVIRIEVDLSNNPGTIEFFKDGVSQGDAFTDIDSTKTWFFWCRCKADAVKANFGQLGFAGTPTANFTALSTTNLPDPTIADPKRYFGTLLYTGNGTTGQTITGLETSSGTSWTPDWVWIKPRSAAYNSKLFDSVRTLGFSLESSTTNAQADLTGEFIAFADGGFQVDDNGSNNINQSGITHVAWNWEAGGSGSSNTDGTVASTVSASATSGFSIAKWTHTTAGNYTVGHGLGAVPKMILVKTTDQGTNWGVYHSDITVGNRLLLNSTSAQIAGYWGANSWTSSTFSIGSARDADGSTMIGYCFAEVESYSSIGSYTGNGSTDGTFIHTGFKPAWVMLKRTNSSQEWQIYDNQRDLFNVAKHKLEPNSSSAESVLTSDNNLDFLSNGFKLRQGNGGMNGSGSSYIYMAFAESPFKTSTAR